MRFLKFNFQDRKFTFLIGVAAILTVVSVLIYPTHTLDASTLGLRIWWNMVFPALLPFFILCDIVIAYGIAHALGVLIDPLLRRLFRLPGIAGWSLISGALAGSPAGVEAVVQLRIAGRIDQLAGERITMMSHYANPIFMITIVAVAFLQRPDLAFFICMVHYMSALGSAIVFRNYLLPSRNSVPTEIYTTPRQSMWSKVSLAIHEARQTDQRSFGQLLGDAVSGSLQKLMMIGGTIMMFSVLLELVSVTGISDLLVHILQWFIQPNSMLISHVDTFISGITEVHMGIYSVTQMGPLSIVWKTAILCGMMGWGGLAVHLQVRALLHATDIRYTPFLLARMVQSFLSMLLVILLWQPYHRWFASAIPSYQNNETPISIADTSIFWDMYLPWRNSYVVFFLLTFMLAAVIYSSRSRSS
ncbi:MAG: nucleoside recognition domain-containing protein [Paenibacillaceae bacterium]